jgi:O-antigen/teichoic acid export membrane protein
MGEGGVIRGLGRWLLTTDGNLVERTLRGGAWLVAGDAVARAAAAARAVVLARLVSSYDFGLFGVSLIVVMWAERVSQWGLSAALIRRPGDVEPYLDTAWTIQLLRGIGFATLIGASAPWLAGFLGSPEATQVIRVVGLLFVLRGLASPAVVRLSRELDFRRFAVLNLGEGIVSVPVGIALGLAWGSVWALVGALVVAEASRAVGSYWIAPYRPRLRLDIVRARELATFGRWVFGFELVRLVMMTVDSVVVGRMLGAQALGLYQMAERIAFLATTEIRGTAVRVMLPAFSRIREGAGLDRALVRALHVVMGVAIPIGALLTVFAEPIVNLLLGSSWGESAAIIRVMVWCGVARAIGGVTVPFFQAAGRPEIPFRTTMVGVILMMLGLGPLVRLAGMVGAATAVTASAVVALVYEIALAVRLFGSSKADLARALVGGVVGAAPFAVAAVIPVVADSPHWLVTLGVTTALGVTAVALSLWIHLRSTIQTGGGLGG